MFIYIRTQAFKPVSNGTQGIILFSIPCAPYYNIKAWVLMQTNMAVSEVDIYKIHPKNLHISRIKAILTVVFVKYLQARY